MCTATELYYYRHHFSRFSPISYTEMDEAEAPIPELSVQPPPPLTNFLSVTQQSTGPIPSERQEATLVPTFRDKVWTFLSSRNLQKLRVLCKDEGIVQRAKNKQGLMERMIRRVCNSGDVRTVWDVDTVTHSKARRNGEKEFHLWITANQFRTNWKVAPTIFDASNSPKRTDKAS